MQNPDQFGQAGAVQGLPLGASLDVRPPQHVEDAARDLRGHAPPPCGGSSPRQAMCPPRATAAGPDTRPPPTNRPGICPIPPNVGRRLQPRSWEGTPSSGRILQNTPRKYLGGTGRCQSDLARARGVCHQISGVRAAHGPRGVGRVDGGGIRLDCAGHVAVHSKFCLPVISPRAEALIPSRAGGDQNRVRARGRARWFGEWVGMQGWGPARTTLPEGVLNSDQILANEPLRRACTRCTMRSLPAPWAPSLRTSWGRCR